MTPPANVNLEVRLRVLLVVERTSWVGGVESYTATLAGQLREAGHTVVVLSAEPPASASGDSWLAGGLSRSRDRVELVAGEVAAFDPDVVHLHTFPPDEYLSALCEKFPSVMSVHNHDVTCPSGTRLLHGPTQMCPHNTGAVCVANAYVRSCNSRRPATIARTVGRAWRTRRVLDRCRRVCVHGEFMRSELAKAGIERGRISVIPSQPSAAFPSSAAMDADPMFVYSGRLVPEKGILLLPRILREVPGVRLTIAGAGHGEQALRSEIRKQQVEDRISIIGELSQAELAQLYRRARAILMPSIWPEPFGLAGLEAMASARPVVGFASGDIPTWLVDGVSGHLVPWLDESRFASALRDLSDGPAAQALGTSARTEFDSRFAAPLHLRKIEALYRGVAADGGR